MSADQTMIFEQQWPALKMIDQERVRDLGTLISYASMCVSVDDSFAEQSVNRRHMAISELANGLIDLESKRKSLYDDITPITSEEEKESESSESDEEKQGSSKRRRFTTTIFQVSKEIVDVLTNLHNLTSDAFTSPKPLCDFGVRHWGVTFLCEILFRLERRRKINELEEQRLRLFIIQCYDVHEDDVSDRLALLDKEIAECKNEFYEATPIYYLDHCEIAEAERKRQIAMVNYSSEELRLQRQREMVIGTKTSELQVKRRLQVFMLMSNGFIRITNNDMLAEIERRRACALEAFRITDDGISNMLAQIEKRRACALEAFRAPVSHPTQIMQLGRNLLMLERSIDALELGDSPEEAYDVISMRGSDFYEKSVDVEKLFNEEPANDNDDILARIARGDDSPYYGDYYF